jgi:PII-like signaling protein
MEILGKAKRVRIYVNEDDRADGKPLHLAIVELLRRENAQGATVLRGVEGFGATGRLHVSNLVDVAWRLPLVIEWIDRPEQVERLAPRVRELVRHGLITVTSRR